MNDFARTWMRRIALGLPIAALPIQGCSSVPECDPPLHEVPFDLASVPRNDGGIDCLSACGELAMGVDAGVQLGSPETCRESMDDPSNPKLICSYYEYVCVGRRPQALVRRSPLAASTALGSWLAQAAHLEATAISAFHELAGELALHGAPPKLSREARRAANDEVRHAASVARLAVRYGALPAPVERSPFAARSLRDLALDNAIEGCAREAYGALSALHQANAAVDPEVGRTFLAIARDEARHALLAFTMHDWLTDRLRPRDRREVEDARHEALEELAQQLAQNPEPELRTFLGVPNAERSVAMVRALA